MSTQDQKSAASPPDHETPDHARITALMKIVAATPEGARLLDLAGRENIRIIMSDNPRQEGADAFFNVADNTIELQRDIDDETLAEALPHELRHLWQSRVANTDMKNLSAADALVLKRVMECDAYAYQARFQMARDDQEISAAIDAMPDRGKAAAAREEFNKVSKRPGMKAMFQDLQSDMDDYDEVTLEVLRLRLELVRIGLNDRDRLAQYPVKDDRWKATCENLDTELKGIFNQVANPRPLDDSLLNILREGLEPSSPKYLRYKTAEGLAAFVRKQIPEKTLAKAQKLEAEILDKLVKAGVGPRP